MSWKACDVALIAAGFVLLVPCSVFMVGPGGPPILDMALPKRLAIQAGFAVGVALMALGPVLAYRRAS